MTMTRTAAARAVDLSKVYGSGDSAVTPSTTCRSSAGAARPVVADGPFSEWAPPANGSHGRTYSAIRCVASRSAVYRTGAP
jgi:hypothetical protein